jgi:hypothetical protein
MATAAIDGPLASRTQPPSFVAFRIVGRQWEPRSHRLREVLTRLALPYRFYPHDSEEGRRLLAEAGQDGRRLPVVVFRTGRVLVDPSHAELAELLGASTRPRPAAMTWPSSAPARPGWPRRSRRPPRACGPWWWSRRCSAGRPGPAP